MKNLFVVKIGSVTRRGAFQENVTKYIETDAEQSAVYMFMRDKYAGFDVKVESIDRVDPLVIPGKTEKTQDEFGLPAEKTIRHFSDLEYSLKIEPFKALFDEAEKTRSAFLKAESALQKAVRDYVGSKPFVSYANEIEIDYSYEKATAKKVVLIMNIVEKTILGEVEPYQSA